MAEAVGRHNARGAQPSQRVTVKPGAYGGQHRAAESTPPAKLGKSAGKAGGAAKRTPTGFVANKAMEKVQEKRAARSAQKAAVKGRVEREQARISAANVLIRRPRIRMLATEYIVAIVLAILILFFSDGSYHDKMARFFLQITGISALFFLLSLTASSERAARTAIMFGLLVDLAILLNATRKVAPALSTQGKPKKIAKIDIGDFSASTTASGGGPI